MFFLEENVIFYYLGHSVVTYWFSISLSALPLQALNARGKTEEVVKQAVGWTWLQPVNLYPMNSKTEKIRKSDSPLSTLISVHGREEQRLLIASSTSDHSKSNPRNL